MKPCEEGRVEYNILQIVMMLIIIHVIKQTVQTEIRPRGYKIL